VIGVGSPFPPFLKDGLYVQADQANNSYVFPGIGLGAIAVRASRISDNMLMAAARALAEISPARTGRSAHLLPPVSELREVSFRVAQAVANQACSDGLAEPTAADAVRQMIEGKIWTPVYRPYRRTA
jgi:malate dehydrogenase (oxaloacetate-decarboxylating)